MEDYKPNKLKVIDFSKEYSKEVAEIISEAVEAKFESIIIFGYKDKKIHCKQSSSKSTLEIIGAREMAKQDLLKSM